MTVATDLQNLVSDLSVAIAEKKTFGRVELERLRRSLTAAASEARDIERAGSAGRLAIENLCEGIETNVLDLAGLATRARAHLSVQ